MNYDPGPVPSMFDRTRLVGTYTILKTYQNCPHQMFHRYIAKDLGPFVETPEIAWGNQVHKAFEERVKGKKPLPVGMQKWENFAAPFDAMPRLHTELQLGITADGKTCDYWAKDVWFRGKVDVAAMASIKAYIVDWKTGGSRYEDRLELDVGALLLAAKFPDLRRMYGHYIWLKENRAGEMYDLSDTSATLAKVRHFMGEIDLDRKRGDFEKRPSVLCGWCPVKSCEYWKERT